MLALDGKYCKYTDHEQCEHIDHTNKCNKCKIQHFLYNHDCIAVIQENMIANCLDYSSSTSCKKCESGYYVFKNQCVKVIEKVPNCLYYGQSQNICAECENGFILTLDNKCQSMPKTDENCQSFSHYDCTKCLDGYIYNRNTYLLNALAEIENGLKNATTIFNIINTDAKNLKYNDFSRCLKIKVQNCQELKTEKECQLCQEGFFLGDQGTCIKFPNSPIDNCQIYSTKSICTQCINQYFLQNNTCIKHITMKNCSDYSLFEKDICIKCSGDYFLNDNTCLSRIKSLNIQDCTTKSIQEDICQQCDSNFVVNFDGLSCIQKLPNCETHEFQNQVLLCQQCQQQYYLAGSQCTKAYVSNCDILETSDSCRQCKYGYYLSNGECFEHTLSLILGCSKMSLSLQNVCEECQQYQVQRQVEGICLPVTKIIHNCEIYKSPTECQSCYRWYSYLNNNTCPLGDIANCVHYAADSNTCLQCRQNVKTKTLYQVHPLNEIGNQCYETDLNDFVNCKSIQFQNNAPFCHFCEETYVPKIFTLINMGFCVPRDNFNIQEYTDKIINCLSFDLDQHFCQECDEGFVTDLDGKCVKQCPEGSYLDWYNIDKTNLEQIIFKYSKRCISGSPQNLLSFDSSSVHSCYIQLHDYKNDNIYCGGCRKTQIPFIKFALLGLQYHGYNMEQMNRQFRYSLDSAYSPIQGCLSRITTISNYLSKQSTPVLRISEQSQVNFQNCRFAGLIGTSGKFACISCNFGYHGAIISDILQQGYFIKYCVKNNDCDSEIYWKSLGSLVGQIQGNVPLIDFFVSCHKCISSTKIPTYPRTLTEINTVVPKITKGYFGAFGLPDDTNTFAYDVVEKKGLQTQCLQPGLGQYVVANCAIQEIRLDMKLSPDQENPNPACVACKPGYFPTLIANTPYVKQCTYIDNCNISTEYNTEFNICDQCIQGFSFKYDANSKDNLSNYMNCIQVENQDYNCSIVDQVTKKCTQCKYEYTLNGDGKCDYISLINCADINLVNYSSLFHFLNWSFQMLGCFKCEQDEIIIQKQNKHRICVQNQQITSNSDISSSSFLIPNCMFYGLSENEKIICQQCDNNFVLSVNQLKCFDFAKVGDNCMQISNEGDICTKCANEYFLNSQGQCVKGIIKNCLVYESENKCAQCSQGSIFTNKAGKQSCFDLPTYYTCQNVINGNAPEEPLKCQQCKQQHYFETDKNVIGQADLGLCLNIPIIENCVSYDNAGGLINSSHVCILCNSEYYLSNSGLSCQKRKYMDKNCLQYQSEKDQCLKCISDYFTGDNGQCTINPQGISNCVDYASLLVCKKCKENYYLQENTCLQLNGNELVADCQFYLKPLVCSQCQPQYFLKKENNQSSCVKPEAQNCKTYKTISQCESCVDKYLRSQISASTVNCVLPQIDKCLQYDLTVIGPSFKCLFCDSGYYLSGAGSCLAVQKIISHCQIYDSETTCQQCYENYILNQPKNKCLDLKNYQNYDQKCQIHKLDQYLKCNSCKSGFYFSEAGQCKKCSFQQQADNCLICDLSNTSKCYACVSRFYHSGEYTCSNSYTKIGLIEYWTQINTNFNMAQVHVNNVQQNILGEASSD